MKITFHQNISQVPLPFIILEGNQSCLIEKENRAEKPYNIKKMSGKQQFLSLMSRVEELPNFNEVLMSQVGRYQIQPFKPENMDNASIRILYSSLEFKYFKSHELSIDNQAWNDNEKKLFVWVIIFYVYFMELDGLEVTPEVWASLSPLFFGKSPQFIYFQYLNLLKHHGKILWTAEEDALLSRGVIQIGEGKWNQISKWFFAESNHNLFKSPKHCRQRYLNHLDEKKKKGQWTLEEDLAIFNFVQGNGKRWCKLVPILNQTRTEHMIKNRYNSIIYRQKSYKRQTEEQLIMRVIKHIKKQQSNIEKRKQKKNQIGQDKSRQQFVQQSKKQQENVQSQIQIIPQSVKIENTIQSLPILSSEFENNSQLNHQRENAHNIMIEEAQSEKVENNNEEEDEENRSQQLSNSCSSPKKELSDQTYIIPEVERYSPPEMPFYSFNDYLESLKNYPFLYQQQMELMQCINFTQY